MCNSNEGNRTTDWRKCYNSNRRELILTHRHLRNIPEDILNSLADQTEYLDLSHNRLGFFQWLPRFKHLKYLILDNNQLHDMHIRMLPASFTTLKVLTLNNNELTDLPATIRLLNKCFPNLEYLSMHGNPLCPDDKPSLCGHTTTEYEYYRNQIKNAMPSVKCLDHIATAAHLIVPPTSSTAYTPSRIFTFTPKMLWLKMTGIRQPVHSPIHNTRTLYDWQGSTSYTGQQTGTVNQLIMNNKRNIDHDSEGNRFICNDDL